jgi:hypothetical protein
MRSQTTKLMLNHEGRPRLLMMDWGTRPPAAAAAAAAAERLLLVVQVR